MSAFKSHLKSIAKAVSWRFVGALDSFAIAYLVTGHAGAAAGFVGFEIATKSLWYYLHERAWEHPVLVKAFGKAPNAAH
jgi:uncharacterized membrane protein